MNTATRRVTGVGSQYHTYSLDWSPQQLTFAINGQTLYTYQPNPRTANNWPFDAPQYLLMNVAMVAGSSPFSKPIVYKSTISESTRIAWTSQDPC